MKSETVIKLIICVIATCCSHNAYSQVNVATENPDQWIAIDQGSQEINGMVSTETKKMAGIAGETTAISLMMIQINKWQKQYNDYLENAEGYANGIVATTSLYGHGIQLLENFVMLKNAVTKGHGAEGLVSTALMTSLLGETAIQLIKTYRVLKFTVAKGGKKNMLNGAQRTELLWILDDELTKLNKMFRELSIMVECYNLTDVFRKYTRGILPPDKDRLARECLTSWRRASRASIRK